MGRSLENATARLTQLPSGPSWDLSGHLMLIGASRQNDIVLETRGISRFHARLRYVAGRWRLEDDDSRNGTWSGKTRLTRHALSHGDELRLGDVELRFEVSRGEAARLPWGRAPGRRPLLLAAGAAAVIAVAIGAMLIAGPTEDAPASARQGSEAGAWEQANTQLCNGELDAAGKLFRRLAVRGPLEQRHAPRTLHRLSALFAEKRPETFRWNTAALVLSRAEKLAGLPEATQEWIQERTAWVESGRSAHAHIERGRDAERRARTHLEAGELDEATAALDEALSAYGAVEPKSPLGALAATALETLGAEAHRVFMSEAQHLIAIDPPEFAVALELIERAESHAATHDQRLEVRSLRAACQRNQQDQAACRRAVRILTERRTEAYPEALELLQQIDPRSHAHAEARMWKAWVEADTETRRADLLYAQGDARSALRLLDRVQATRLDGAALKVVLERRERWTRVARSWERARQLSRKGDPLAARAVETVLRLEGDTANHYNRLARRQLSYLAESNRDGRQLTVERGLRALRSGDYSAAHRAFEAVRLDPARKPGDGARIASAVRQANSEQRLVGEGRRVLMADSVERFEELEVRFELLWRWLHPGDPQRAVAKKCLRVLSRRRAVLEQIEAQERAS